MRRQVKAGQWSKRQAARRSGVRHRGILALEVLETRTLLYAGMSDADDVSLSHNSICCCGGCQGTRTAESPTTQTGEPELAYGCLTDLIVAAAATTTVGTTAGAILAPLSSLPALNSFASSAYSIYLDFNGHFNARWGSYRNATTPVFDTDGNTSTFSSTELNMIQDIWARVAEDYAPFNINVTTVDPGTTAFSQGRAVRVAIGGSYSDWFRQASGGVAYVGSFASRYTDTVYVFSRNLGSSKAIAEAASHEAGHAFGLQHQSSYNSAGQKTAEYNQGNSSWAPIMGVGYYSARTTWWNGPNSISSTTRQDDVAVILRSSNRFGARADEAGSTTATAARLAVSSGVATAAGVIGSTSDLDLFSFSTSGRALDFSIRLPNPASNLIANDQLRNAAGTVIASSVATATNPGRLLANVGSGTYYIAVSSNGAYGSLGQYFISGNVSAANTAGSLRNIAVFTTSTSGSQFSGVYALSRAALDTATDSQSWFASANGSSALNGSDSAFRPATQLAVASSNPPAPGVEQTFEGNAQFSTGDHFDRPGMIMHRSWGAPAVTPSDLDSLWSAPLDHLLELIDPADALEIA